MRAMIPRRAENTGWASCFLGIGAKTRVVAGFAVLSRKRECGRSLKQRLKQGLRDGADDAMVTRMFEGCESELSRKSRHP
jgi:hypothetical protein